MLPLATALEKTGAGKMIADRFILLMGTGPSPYVITAMLFFVAWALSQFMSNTATAALLCPIGIAIAQGLGAHPQAVVMAIGVAASCAFATPVGTPPNTLVYGPGNFNGRPRLACETQTNELHATTIEVRALPNYDIVKDLVVD